MKEYFLHFTYVELYLENYKLNLDKIKAIEHNLSAAEAE